LKSVFLRALVLLVVEACGGAPTTAESGDDAGVAMGDDAGTFQGALFSMCGALGKPCCAIATRSQPVAPERLTAGGVTCAEGLACVMGVCERPSAADASSAADAVADVSADTGAAPGVHPVGPTLAVGGDHVCVLRGGKVECWGSNNSGDLGIGVSSGPQSCNGTACSPAPVAVTGLSASVESVAAGDGQTCALLAGGTVACWGANDIGQLGDGSTSGPEMCQSQFSCSTTPSVVSGVSGATAVATNGEEACAVVSGGAVKCWGSNGFGALGNGTTATDLGGSSVPTMVSGLTRATAVAIGYDYACALLRDGTIECWGTNDAGQLGNGSTTNATTPVPVSGITGATAIATGWYNTCALMADGTVACWGANGDGELGFAIASSPQTCTSNNDACATTPVKVPNLSGVTAIAAGMADACAVLSDGTVRCWGLNWSGELGNGTTTNSSTPVVVSGLSGASAIAMGNQSTCALVSSGGVVCWGDNSLGQLATAPTGPQKCISTGASCSSTPVNVSGL
jgi:alpha-tubulin suppressor-like RCC1 family protein